jgi:hypothetical protein
MKSFGKSMPKKVLHDPQRQINPQVVAHDRDGGSFVKINGSIL